MSKTIENDERPALPNKPGRILILPCAIGDIVWDKNAEPHEVIAITVWANNVVHLRTVSKATKAQKVLSLGKRSIGKTVFLSWEDAIASHKKK